MTVPGATEQAMDAGGQEVDPDEEAPASVLRTPCLALDGGGLCYYARQLGGGQAAGAEQLSASVPHLARFLYRLLSPSIRLLEYVRPEICKLVLEGAEDLAKTMRREAQGRFFEVHRQMLAAWRRGDDTELLRLRAAAAAAWRVPYEAIFQLLARLRAAGVPIYGVVALGQGDHQALAEAIACCGGVWASRDGEGFVHAGPLPQPVARPATASNCLTWLSVEPTWEPRFALDGSLPALATDGKWGPARRLFYSCFQGTDYHAGVPSYGPAKGARLAKECPHLGKPISAVDWDEVVRWVTTEESLSVDQAATLQHSIQTNLEGQFGAPVLRPLGGAIVHGAAADTDSDDGDSPLAKRQRGTGTASGRNNLSGGGGAAAGSATGPNTAGQGNVAEGADVVAAPGDSGRRRPYRSALLAQLLEIQVPQGAPPGRPACCLNLPDADASADIAAGLSNPGSAELFQPLTQQQERTVQEAVSTALAWLQFEAAGTLGLPDALPPEVKEVMRRAPPGAPSARDCARLGDAIAAGGALHLSCCWSHDGSSVSLRLQAAAASLLGLRDKTLLVSGAGDDDMSALLSFTGVRPAAAGSPAIVRWAAATTGLPERQARIWLQLVPGDNPDLSQASVRLRAGTANDAAAAGGAVPASLTESVELGLRWWLLCAAGVRSAAAAQGLPALGDVLAVLPVTQLYCMRSAWQAAGGGGAPLTADELQELGEALEALQEAAAEGRHPGPPPLEQLLPVALQHLRGGAVRLTCYPNGTNGASWTVYAPQAAALGGALVSGAGDDDLSALLSFNGVQPAAAGSPAIVRWAAAAADLPEGQARIWLQLVPGDSPDLSQASVRLRAGAAYDEAALPASLIDALRGALRWCKILCAAGVRGAAAATAADPPPPLSTALAALPVLQLPSLRAAWQAVGGGGAPLSAAELQALGAELGALRQAAAVDGQPGPPPLDQLLPVALQHLRGGAVRLTFLITGGAWQARASRAAAAALGGALSGATLLVSGADDDDLLAVLSFGIGVQPPAARSPAIARWAAAAADLPEGQARVWLQLVPGDSPDLSQASVRLRAGAAYDEAALSASLIDALRGALRWCKILCAAGVRGAAAAAAADPPPPLSTALAALPVLQLPSLRAAWQAVGGGGAPLSAAELQALGAELGALRQAAAVDGQPGPPPLDQLLPVALQHMPYGAVRLACYANGAFRNVVAPRTATAALGGAVSGATLLVSGAGNDDLLALLSFGPGALPTAAGSADIARWAAAATGLPEGQARVWLQLVPGGNPDLSQASVRLRAGAAYDAAALPASLIDALRDALRWWLVLRAVGGRGSAAAAAAGPPPPLGTALAALPVLQLPSLRAAWQAAGGGGAPLTAAELQALGAELGALRQAAAVDGQPGPPPLDELLPVALQHLRGGAVRLTCYRNRGGFQVCASHAAAAALGSALSGATLLVSGAGNDDLSAVLSFGSTAAPTAARGTVIARWAAAATGLPEGKARVWLQLVPGGNPDLSQASVRLRAGAAYDEAALPGSLIDALRGALRWCKMLCAAGVRGSAAAATQPPLPALGSALAGMLVDGP